jgi:phosphorylcholine metabolism protein LicD
VKKTGFFFHASKMRQENWVFLHAKNVNKDPLPEMIGNFKSGFAFLNTILQKFRKKNLAWNIFIHDLLEDIKKSATVGKKKCLSGLPYCKLSDKMTAIVVS